MCSTTQKVVEREKGAVVMYIIPSSFAPSGMLTTRRFPVRYSSRLLAFSLRFGFCFAENLLNTLVLSLDKWQSEGYRLQ